MSMKIDVTTAKPMTNFEVWQKMCKIRAEYNEAAPNNPPKTLSVATVAYEICSYLEETSCAQQNLDMLKDVLKKLSKFSLTHVERMAIVNFALSKPVDLHTVIQQCEERFDSDQIEQISKIIKESLPDAPSQS